MLFLIPFFTIFNGFFNDIKKLTKHGILFNLYSHIRFKHLKFNSIMLISFISGILILRSSDLKCVDRIILRIRISDLILKKEIKHITLFLK